jgi:peptidoglycan hydrolase-like protein with peptidoglycan-binding domain
MSGRSSARTLRAVVIALSAVVALAGCAGLDASWSSDEPQRPRATDLAGGPTPTTTAAPPTAATPSARPSANLSANTPPPTTAPPTPTPSRTTTPTPTPAPSAKATSTPSAKATPKPSAKTATKASPTATPSPKPRTTLKYGDRGPKVLALQQRLTDLGYWLGKPDGSFGPLTQQAVYALQKAAGISRDGVVGPRTTKALADGIRPRATLSGDGVEIVLDRQLLLVVRGGMVRTILNTSTGNREAYTSTSGNRAIAVTPKGSFTVYRGVDGPLTNSLGELWRPRFFHRGIAVHGSPNIPPWPASHGCARVSNAAINMIWDQDLMPIGSRVVVR